MRFDHHHHHHMMITIIIFIMIIAIFVVLIIIIIMVLHIDEPSLPLKKVMAAYARHLCFQTRSHHEVLEVLANKNISPQKIPGLKLLILRFSAIAHSQRC